MAINFDQALGIHPLALTLRDRRAELLASNLANADTPDFKARDLDFQAVLKGVREPSVQLALTRGNHILPARGSFDAETKYRVPAQAALDGNTVESEQEQVRYAQNALQYQFSLRLVSDKFAGLRTAIRGD